MATQAASRKAPWRHPDRFFIGGEWVSPASDRKIDVINPSTEEIYVSVAEATSSDVNRAVAAARDAFDHGPWPRTTHDERADYIRKIAAGIRCRGDDISADWSSHMGIVNSVAEAYTAGVAQIYDAHAGYAKSYQFIERHTPSAGGQFGFLVREPVGVVAAVIPWNAPILLIANKLAPALLAGCTVILKASPEAPGAAYIMAEIAQDIGLPAGVLNILTADRAVSEELIRHPDVDKVSFTGSTAAGKRIASLCGERIARCTLELGGKSAGVILDDYDLETAALSIAGSASLLTGQACSSLTRIIVSDRRHDAFVEALSASFSRIRVGDPFAPETQMGPLAMRRQRDRVEGLVATGLSEGAKLATGGGKPKTVNRGFFFEPTVFGDVDNSSTIAREEFFGPVLSVVRAKDEADALALANQSEYGLNASVFTNDAERALRAARALRSGTVGHNSFRSDFGIAFGGFKQSGIGREGGTEGLLPYLETKTIILDELPKRGFDNR